MSQPAPFVTVGVGLKGCELFRVNDLHPWLAHRHVQIRINYPADGTSLPGKKKNEVLPLILVNVLFLATPGAIMGKKNILASNHSSPFVMGAMRQLIRGFMSCCFFNSYRAQGKPPQPQDRVTNGGQGQLERLLVAGSPTLCLLCSTCFCLGGRTCWVYPLAPWPDSLP